MVAGLPNGYALKMLKKLIKNGEKMVAGRPVTIFIAFSFEFFTNREPKVGAAADGRPLYFLGAPVQHLDPRIARSPQLLKP